MKNSTNHGKTVHESSFTKNTHLKTKLPIKPFSNLTNTIQKVNHFTPKIPNFLHQ